MKIELDGDRIHTSVELDGDVRISYLAENVAMQRTGVHAKVSVYVEKDLLAFGRMNTDNNDQRVRLSNRAHKQLGSRVQEAYPIARANHDLDLFCARLWDAYTEQYVAEFSEGDPDYQPTYYARPLVLEGGGTIVFAPGGSGKSFLAMTLACSIEYGHEEVWPGIHCYPVLYVNLERDPRLMRRRLAHVNVCLGADARTPLRFLHARGRSLTDIKDGIARTVEEQAIGVVVVDSISRTGIGNLNDNEPANAIIDTLNHLCPTWFAVAHTAKANRNEVFGSAHFENGADITVRLTHQERDGTLGMRLKQMKTNDVGKDPDQWLAFDFADTRLTGIRPATKEEFPDLQESEKAEERIHDYLAQQGSATVSDISREFDIADGTVRKLLNADKDRFTRLAGTDQRAGVWALKYDER